MVVRNFFPELAFGPVRIMKHPGSFAISSQPVRPEQRYPEIYDNGGLVERFERVRRFSEILCEPLEPEDFVIQSMMEASPTKWHLAHTSWFFETFILKAFSSGYVSSVPEYAYLFNSYYNAAGPMHCRDRRGMISRPTVAATMEYRRHIDACMMGLLDGADEALRAKLDPLVTLGIHHEQQHQELMLTDIKHVFAQNPLHPVYRERELGRAEGCSKLEWVPFPEGVYCIGFSGEGFSYDNEGPRHRQFLEPFALGDRLVTSGEFKGFMEDGGYERPELWLSLGWQAVQQNGWRAPLYWESRDNAWMQFTLQGLRPVLDDEPVCHVSFFEADAFARWAGARLPTEAEWEVAAEDSTPKEGHFVDDQLFHPGPTTVIREPGVRLKRMYGDVWEWTGSSYRPYPGYRPPEGALGEYNGKFMCSQMVLRGGSCATSRAHIRPTYRNFFPPDKRWQFSGIRLAKDL
jgi:ergothioneine biosynthesis protein EgtB